MQRSEKPSEQAGLVCEILANKLVDVTINFGINKSVFLLTKRYFSPISSSHSGPEAAAAFNSSAAMCSDTNKATSNGGCESGDEKSSDGGGDWAYITFPNGVPQVQDIKTNKAKPDSNAAATGVTPAVGNASVTNGATGAGQAHPVKVVTRDVPGVNFPFSQGQGSYGAVPMNGHGHPAMKHQMPSNGGPASFYGGVVGGSPRLGGVRNAHHMYAAAKVSTPTGNPTLDQINARSVH